MTVAKRQNDETAEPKMLLKNFCDNGFAGDLAEAGLVLGRPPEELESMINGNEAVDDDLEMKVRGIAQERGISL